MQQQQRSQIDLYQPQGTSQIIQGDDGKLYQVSELTPIQLRQQQSIRRNRQANQFAYCVLGIGAVFVGVIALLIFGAILVAATRPVPPPPVDCPWVGSCNVGNGQ